MDRQSAEKKAAQLAQSKGLTVVGAVRELKNGAFGATFSDKKFRIVQGNNDSLAVARKSPRGAKPLSSKAAARAFAKYYATKKYSSQTRRAAAIQRDLCHSKKGDKVTSLSKFRRSPGRFDYPGLDDGTKCKGKSVKSVSPSRKALDALALINEQRRMGRISVGGQRKSQRKSSKKGHKQQQRKSQTGAGCAWNASSLRCNKVKGSGNDDLCRVSKKNRCSKTRDAPKRSATRAQLDVLSKGRDTRTLNTEARRLGSIELSGGKRKSQRKSSKKGHKQQQRKSQTGAGCAWNASTLRCKKVKGEGNDELCRVSKKNRCSKSRDAPKRSASRAQLANLSKGRAVRDTKAESRRLGSIDLSGGKRKSSKKGSKKGHKQQSKSRRQ
jgi:hypothetical protein